MVIQSFNPSASQSVKRSLSDSLEQSTLQQQRQFVDLSESDLSCRLAVCCMLSVTCPNTTAYFSARCGDGRRGDRKKRQANTHCPQFINQTAVVLHYGLNFQGCVKAICRYSPGMNFKKVLI